MTVKLLSQLPHEPVLPTLCHLSRSLFKSTRYSLHLPCCPPLMASNHGHTSAIHQLDAHDDIQLS